LKINLAVRGARGRSLFRRNRNSFRRRHFLVFHFSRFSFAETDTQTQDEDGEEQLGAAAVDCKFQKRKQKTGFEKSLRNELLVNMLTSKQGMISML
jgi:hypothetical protein